MSYTIFLISGTIGFFSCLWFVRKIYSVVKVDWYGRLTNVNVINWRYTGARILLKFLFKNVFVTILQVGVGNHPPQPVELT